MMTLKERQTRFQQQRSRNTNLMPVILKTVSYCQE